MKNARNQHRTDYAKELVKIVQTTKDREELKKKIAAYHERDIANAIVESDKTVRKCIYDILDIADIAEIFSYIEEEPGKYLEEMPIEQAAKVVSSMDSDDAMDLFEELNEEDKYKLLKRLDKEAKEDGIKSRRNPGTGETYYYPHCSECGTEVFSLSYIRGRKYTCKECKDKKYFTDKKKSIDRSNEAKERKFENALKRIQSVVGSMKMGEYETAIEAVRKVLYRDGWFESTEEIMVAIELVKNNFRIRHQVKVNRYRADFVLPDQKIILEVDERNQRKRKS